jgi:predicted HicB family RNase H-like nuclease
MKYKGYTGVVEFDEESGMLFGHVIGLRDGITFQGESVAEVTQAFHDSVDVYLEFCAKRGESPEKPYSGQFVLRIDPKLHRALSHAAEERGKSLNSLIEEQLAAAFTPGGERHPAAPGAAAAGRAARRSGPAKAKEATASGLEAAVAEHLHGMAEASKKRVNELMREHLEREPEDPAKRGTARGRKSKPA